VSKTWHFVHKNCHFFQKTCNWFRCRCSSQCFPDEIFISCQLTLPKIVNFVEKNVKFLVICWHSNGNFREGQVVSKPCPFDTEINRKLMFCILQLYQQKTIVLYTPVDMTEENHRVNVETVLKVDHLFVDVSTQCVVCWSVLRSVLRSV